MKRTLTVVFMLLMVALGAQFALRRVRTVAAPALAEGAFAALGGLRSMAAEVIWFRADRLQDEGRYVELAQLASALTTMEPHTPEVWSYAAWNLAYNVSVMMPTFADRWRWVDAAIRLLRDEGLVLNPGDPDLCRDLAFIFRHKLGQNEDAASDAYRAIWRERVEDVAKRDAWEELRMNRAKMRAIESRTKLSDWGDPCLSAIYWSMEGLPLAKDKSERAMLELNIRLSLALYHKRPHPESASHGCELSE